MNEYALEYAMFLLIVGGISGYIFIDGLKKKAERNKERVPNQDPETVMKRIRSLPINQLSKMLNKKEIQEIPHVLMPDEELYGMATGLYSGENGILVATNRRVFFLSKNLIGERVEDFPYGVIGSIQHETGMAGGVITISAVGSTAKIRWVPFDQVREFCDIARMRLFEHHGKETIS